MPRLFWVPAIRKRPVGRGERKAVLQIVHPHTNSKNFKMPLDLSQDHVSQLIFYHLAVVHLGSQLRIVTN